MNKSRIEILKMKAKRTGSRKELVDELSNIVTVSMDSFMDPKSNDLFCKDLFNTLTLFFSKGGKIEAVKLNIGEVFENLEALSTISKFLTGYADFVLVGDDLEFGIVIERTEYHYEFSMWGVSTI